MIMMSLMIIGIIASLIDKTFIKNHIVTEIDPDDENF